MKFRGLFVVLAVCATLLSFTQSRALAQSKAFKVTGAGTVDAFPIDEQPFSATGTATHFGRYDAFGHVQGNPNTGEFWGRIRFTGANGDALTFDFEGDVTLVPDGAGAFKSSKWDAIFKPDTSSGTGRFARVTGGSFQMIARTGPFLIDSTHIPFRWSGDGRLEFAKGKKK